MKNNRLASRNLIKAIDPCLPATFRNNSHLSLEDLIRARVLTAIILSGMVVTVFAALVFFVSHILSGNDFSNPITIAFVCFVAVGLNYLFFYKSGRLDATAILFSLTFFVAVVTSIILTGGFNSPVRIMLICTPVVAFLIGGRQEGIYNAVLSFFVGIVLLVLDVYGFEMLQIMPEPIVPYLSGVIWLVSLLVIVVCLYVYDVLLEDTRHTIVRADSTDES